MYLKFGIDFSEFKNLEKKYFELKYIFEVLPTAETEEILILDSLENNNNEN